MPNIACVDDHKLILEGLRGLINQNKDFQWVAEFDCVEGLEFALEAPNEIDIILIDLFYQRENRLGGIGNMIKKFPSPKWIVISAYDSKNLVQQAFSLGVAAYLRKDVSLQELNHCLQQVWDGKKMLNYSYFSERTTFVVISDNAPLSSRESEIILLIVKGYTEQKIAEVLYISKHTVHTHRKNILRKLGLHSNVDIIKYYLENNL